MEQRALWMARAAGAVFLLLFLLTILQALAAIRMAEGWIWAVVLPMPFYLYAMFATWRALTLVARGAKLAPQLSRLMRRSGIALFIGGLVEVFGTNVVLVGSGAAAQPINITAIVIGVIGVGLFGLAGLIDEGRAARAELDEFV
ncbi:hypothetical protein [Sphingomicrobium clamense]|uniref:DUF2975 domain-containing protein n=1 Tax=Sphingomicrobium clamense TaxID=2851013 RepID=A0ABS6V684_9SPHN|nr:hypothetical protein [Sphingomicrobium sp. B8]MBW0145082.1 hypothetical protein [Sphingomicrobium sp. B8]